MRIKKFNESLVGGDSPKERSIDLREPEGNAYSILATAKQFTNQLKDVDSEKYNWERIEKEMTSSDYKNLVTTFDKYFGDFVTIYNADVLDESITEGLFDKGEDDDLKVFKDVVSGILDSQVGTEKNLKGWEIIIVEPGHLKMNHEDGTECDLILKAPDTKFKSNSFKMINLNSSGGFDIKLKQQDAQEAYDEMINLNSSGGFDIKLKQQDAQEAYDEIIRFGDYEEGAPEEPKVTTEDIKESKKNIINFKDFLKR